MSSVPPSHPPPSNAGAASGWEGITTLHDGWEYSFFSRPTNPASARAVCRQHGAVLQPLGNAAEEALLASTASRWARGLPLLVEGGGAVHGSNASAASSVNASCWLLGGTDPNDAELFVPGVVRSVRCHGLEAAFVCRKGERGTGGQADCRWRCEVAARSGCSGGRGMS